ncbi:unnamed protein product, partial [Prorocentrum cordatum]
TWSGDDVLSFPLFLDYVWLVVDTLQFFLQHPPVGGRARPDVRPWRPWRRARPAHLLRPPAAAPSAGLAGGLQGLLTLQQAALAQETAVEVRVMDAAAVERGNQILFSFVGVAAVLVALTAFVVTRGQDERGDLL